MIHSRLPLGALAAALAALPTVASAQQEDRLSVDVAASAGYSNNPFAIFGDDTESALASIDILPRYQILSQNSALTISGAASFQQYLRRYGNNDSYSGAVDYELRPSERLRAHTRLDLSSAIIGANNTFLPALIGGGQAAPLPGVGTGVSGNPVVAPPATVVPLPGFTPGFTDVGLFGLRNRRRLARLSGDGSLGLSARDSLTFSAYGELTRYRDLPLFGDYEAYGASLGYSRRISDRLNLGVRASASKFDYRQANSDSRVFPVEATVSARLSPIWTVDGALGVTFVDSDAAHSTSRTSVSGNVNACRRGELSSMCFQAARQVSATGLVGSQYVTTAGVSWSKRLGERENLSLNASYSNIGGDDEVLVGDGLPLQTEFVQAALGYDRQISERLRFVASANYRQLLDGNGGRPKDFGGQVGLSYRFGDLR